MTEKIAIVYVGQKPMKRTVYHGQRYKFLQNKPTSIDSDAAYHFLQFSEVFCLPEDVDKKHGEQEAAEKLRQEREERARRAAAESNASLSCLVKIDGEMRDISKYTVGKLKTVIELESLDDVRTERVSADSIRKDVCKRLHRKYGTPMVEIPDA